MTLWYFNNFRIGRRNLNGDFQWIDGSDENFLNWDEDEPNKPETGNVIVQRLRVWQSVTEDWEAKFLQKFIH